MVSIEVRVFTHFINQYISITFTIVLFNYWGLRKPKLFPEKYFAFFITTSPGGEYFVFKLITCFQLISSARMTAMRPLSSSMASTSAFTQQTTPQTQQISLLPAVRQFQTSAVSRDIDSAAKFIGAGAATVGVAGSGTFCSYYFCPRRYLCFNKEFSYLLVDNWDFCSFPSLFLTE